MRGEAVTVDKELEFTLGWIKLVGWDDSTYIDITMQGNVIRMSRRLTVEYAMELGKALIWPPQFPKPTWTEGDEDNADEILGVMMFALVTSVDIPARLGMRSEADKEVPRILLKMEKLDLDPG